MSGKFEVIEPNKVRITFNIDAVKFEDGVNQAYKRSRGKINIPGFRKGKAPRKIIELNFGKDIFYEDAINIVLPEIYEDVVNELKLKTVSRPEISVEDIDVDDGVTISAEVFIKPEITVSPEIYKNAQYTPFAVEVTDDEINAEIDKAREQNSRMVSVQRAVENGDHVTIDFEGFTDGEPFEGGKGADHNLIIGSHSFIDTFEEQLVGANVGDDVEVNVTFPEVYHAEALAGKPAVFKVQVKEIRVKELPEVDDDFAQDISDFETLSEYKDSIRAKLESGKEDEAKRKKNDELINYIIKNTEMDIPEIMIENQIDQMVQDFSNQVRAQGIPMETYLQYMGQDMTSMRNAYKEGAENQVRGRLVLEAIAEAEGYEASEEEKEAEMVRMAEGYGIDLERIKEILRREDSEGLEEDIKVKKAMDFIVENAVAKEVLEIVENDK